VVHVAAQVAQHVAELVVLVAELVAGLVAERVAERAAGLLAELAAQLVQQVAHAFVGLVDVRYLELVLVGPGFVELDLHEYFVVGGPHFVFL